MSSAAVLQAAAASSGVYDKAASMKGPNATAARRQLTFLREANLGVPSNLTVAEELSDVVGRMSGIYASAQVCGPPELLAAAGVPAGRCLDLDPELTNVMADSRNFTLLLDAWKARARTDGPPLHMCGV